MALNAPAPTSSLNTISVKLEGFAPAIVPILGSALGQMGITIGHDTFLVPGDFSEWVFFLSEASGGDERLYKIYSLSAFEGGQQGLQARVRAMCREHLLNELKQLGLEPPKSF